MKYIINDKISYQEINTFFKQLDLVKGDKFFAHDVFHYNQRNKTLELKAIKASKYITVRDKNILIGFVRFITDSYFYFIIEVAVLPEYQCRGIGRKLLNKTISYIKKQKFIKIFLFSIPGKENYYKKFGFKETRSQAMEIRSDV